MPPTSEDIRQKAAADPPADSLVPGRVIYLLALVALVHFIYPMTLEWPGAVTLIGYNVLYAGMFAVGIWIVGSNRRLRILTLLTAITYFGFSVLYALDPTNSRRILITYLALIPFQTAMILTLGRFIFAARRVDRDILFAAVTVYLLLAAIFVPIYGILEVLQPGAIVDNLNPDTAIVWQQLIYYSLVTLTTTGYGDILPVSPWARALANAESVIGVLFIAITMARLVGLYSQHEN